MYAYMKQIHPPTGIELCEFCHFFNMRQKNLLVAGKTVLQVFNLIPTDEDPEESPAPDDEANGAAQAFQVGT